MQSIAIAILISDSYFMEQFQKSGYDATESACFYYCVLIITYV